LVSFEYLRDRSLDFSAENTPDFPSTTVVTEKHMLTVFCNPDGFHVVTILPRGASFNTTWLIDGNPVPLRDQFFPGGTKPRQKKLMVHIDNSRAMLQR
jgi:hypothetical protein